MGGWAVGLGGVRKQAGTMWGEAVLLSMLGLAWRDGLGHAWRGHSSS